MPTVSAIITTFNRVGYLPGAIRSVLAQTFTDFELLILDNSSTDGTEEVVKGFTEERIRYIRHEPITIGKQRNVGLHEAKGRFIAFLDDDDEWLPIKLQLQMATFRRSEDKTALVYGGFVRIDPGGDAFYTYFPKLRGRVLHDLLWQRDPFTGSASNPMIRRSTVMSVGGYNDSISASEDWELYLRLAEKYEVEYVPEVLVKIRSHRSPRLGDRVGEALKVEQMVLERYVHWMDPSLRSFYLQKIGGKLCRIGSISEGRQRIGEAIRTHPFNGLAYAQYLFSYLGPPIYRRIHWCYKRLA